MAYASSDSSKLLLLVRVGVLCVRTYQLPFMRLPLQAASNVVFLFIRLGSSQVLFSATGPNNYPAATTATAATLHLENLT